MKEKKISWKIIGIIAVVAVVLISLAVFLVIHFSGSKNSYRSIQIYELEGKASIDRKGVGSLDAVENIYLESNDRVQVSEGSHMRLKVDGDKYIMVEENSIFSIVAEGTEKDSKTSINLEKGAITSEIQNKLSKKSGYEVTTPNSVMAVRGTVFRVEVIIDENLEIHTKLTVFEGEVSVQLLKADGTKEGEEVIVKAGQELVVHTDEEETSVLFGPRDIDYHKLSIQCLEFLKEVINRGRNLDGIDEEEIDSLIEQLRTETNEGNNSQEDGDDSQNTTEQSSQTDDDNTTEQSSRTDDDNTTGQSSPTDDDNTTGQSSPTDDDNATGQSSPTDNDNVTAGLDSESPNNNNRIPAPASNGTESSIVEKTPLPVISDDLHVTFLPVTNPPSGNKEDVPSDDNTDSPNQTAEPSVETKTCTVTFSYNGMVFGTQTVKAGQTITVPKLAPAARGAWDYDFSKPVTNDITIIWK